MIWRGLFILTILSNCVLSLPVTSSQLENEDVKVMKCIVEALADVLSRPHPMPVSQECLVTLKTDDRLVTILRHHNFLKELQEIAVQGGRERAELQRDTAAPDPMTQTPQTADEAADQSMLEALGGPGERSILSQKKRRTENEDREEEKDESRRDGESRDIGEEVQVKRGDETGHESHVSESVDEWTEGKAEKREEEEEEEEEQEEEEEKRANSEEETMTKDKKGAESEEKRDAPRNKPKEKKFDEEDVKEEKEKRSSHFSHGDDEELIEKRSSRENVKRWTKRGKGLQLKKKADVKEAQEEEEEEEEVPHHSKEVAENRQEEEKKKKRNTQRSPEEKELQMIARRAPEEKRGGSEEEGSAGRKSEEPEIESLAAIESELEDVAQKLHELRRG